MILIKSLRRQPAFIEEGSEVAPAFLSNVGDDIRRETPHFWDLWIYKIKISQLRGSELLLIVSPGRRFSNFNKRTRYNIMRSDSSTSLEAITVT